MNIGNGAQDRGPAIAANWLRQNGRCFWCGCPLTLRQMDSQRKGAFEEQRERKWRDWTIEHFLPSRLVPSRDPYYIVIACCACNTDKGGALPSLAALAAFATMRECDGIA